MSVALTELTGETLPRLPGLAEATPLPGAYVALAGGLGVDVATGGLRIPLGFAGPELELTGHDGCCCYAMHAWCVDLIVEGLTELELGRVTWRQPLRVRWADGDGWRLEIDQGGPLVRARAASLTVAVLGEQWIEPIELIGVGG